MQNSQLIMKLFTYLVVLLILVCTSTSFGYDTCSFDECTEAAPIRVKHKKSSKDDPSILNITFECKNESGDVLYKCETEEKNPYGPNVQVQSYSYKSSISKTYTSGGGKGVDVNINNNNNKEEVETFD